MPLEYDPMSIKEPVVIKCPNCGHEQATIVWESLNADVDPDARIALLQGQINQLTCEGCGEVAEISVPLLYHDMTRRYVTQYVPFDLIEDDEFILRFDADGQDTSFTNAMDDWSDLGVDSFSYMSNPHIVFQMSELQRYVLFRERLYEIRALQSEDI